MEVGIERRKPRTDSLRTHLADPSYILVARLLVEPQILIKSKPHVVAVEPVRELAKVEEMLLEGDCDRRLNDDFIDYNRFFHSGYS